MKSACRSAPESLSQLTIYWNKSARMSRGGFFWSARQIRICISIWIWPKKNPKKIRFITSNMRILEWQASSPNLATWTPSVQVHLGMRQSGSAREAELLYLVSKTKETLADVLKLLGISQPEKM